MDELELINSNIIEKNYKEHNVVFYTLYSEHGFQDLIVLENDEISLFLKEEQLNVGSSVTLIYVNKEIIGLLNKKTSHMLLFKDKKEYVGVNVNYNYYQRKLDELKLSKSSILELIKNESEVTESKIKVAVLISSSNDELFTTYVVKYYNNLGEERYATLKVDSNDVSNLIDNPINGVTTLRIVIENGEVIQVLGQEKINKLSLSE